MPSSGLFWDKLLWVSLANIHRSLTSEIKAYEAYMRLSPREEAASELVVSDVNSVARNQPEIKPLTLLGSRSTGLASPISDFDFSFTMPVSLPGGWIIPPSEGSVSQPQPLKLEKRRKALQALRKMKRHFDSSKKFSGTELIQHARVPIIRSKHIATGLDIQIQTMAPYQAAHEYTIAYLSEFPSLRPLYIILRYCLELRDLTTVFKGGLGSYSILMMIVTAMKHASGKFASDDLGSQLLHVLEFYGEADLYKFGFSANPPRFFEKQKERWSLEERMARMNDPQLSGIDQMQTFYPRKPYLLCLQDPANDLNDLGKNAYAIKHIQATFRHAKHTIQTALESNDEESDDRARGKIWSCLDQVVRADYRAFELHRSRTEQCTSRRKLNDGDYSEEMIIRKFEKRVNRYKGVVDEDDDLPETVLEAVDGNAAKSIEAEYSSNGSAGSADNIVAWYQQKLVRRRQNVIRSNFRQAKKAASKKATENLQKLHGTNDDERGWKTASASDQKTLLETPPESGLPNLFRKLESNAPLLRSHAVASWTRTVGRGMEISSTPTTAAKSPETGPQYLSQKSDVVRVRRLDTDVVEGRTRATERRRKASSPPTNAALFSRRARRPLVRNFNSKHKEPSSLPPPSPSSAITEIRKVAVTLPENLSLDQLRNHEAGQDSWARIAARGVHDRVVKKQRGKGSRRRRSSIKTVKTSIVTKRYIDAFKLRRTLLPTLHKRVLVSEDMTKRLESDGAILPRSKRDPKGIPGGS